MNQFRNNTNSSINNTDINTSLDADEAAGLLFMREEEKVAHDVYTTLYEQWGLPIFDNISDSEERHEDQVEILLDRYQIPDPADGNAIGVFTDPDLQQLYDTLVVQGSQSLTDALQVGVLIEETDIVDLQERIAQTDNADIQQVYGQLLNGSNNHLSAFTSSLTGGTVDPLTGAIADPILAGNCAATQVLPEQTNSANATDFAVNSVAQMNPLETQNFEAIDPNLNGYSFGAIQAIDWVTENPWAIVDLSEYQLNGNFAVN
jgi:hypothetical protein